MKVGKSTAIWLVVFGVAVATVVAIRAVTGGDLGCVGGIAFLAAVVSGIALVAIGLAAAVHAIVRRLTLRLAFSYFLIGIVPIPLLAALLFAGAYLVAHQIVATTVRREVAAVGVEAAADPAGNLPGFRADADGRVASSDVSWLARGTAVPWVSTLKEPRPVVVGDDAWLVAAVPGSPDRFALLLLTDPEGKWARRVAERTGYAVDIEPGTSRKSGRGFNIDFSGDRRKAERNTRRKGKWEDPKAGPAAQPGRASFLERKWVAGVYLDKPIAAFAPVPDARNVVIYAARTSPRALFEQLFAQGVPEVGRVFWGIFGGLAAMLLLVYLVALAIAFTLVGTLARNVNRLTRASRAVAAGDFSVRVNSRSRDQIGDLARGFDGMASSIQGLLVDTARKERLESEIAVARTIQQKLLPPPAADLPGLRIRARFEPLAEIGGDYYDYAPVDGDRTAAAVGDVSGHGLPTGLVVAMAKAALMTLLESGLEGTALFVKLNELIFRSTDSRNYMTLALFVYDPGTRIGTLTNAGQLAPYRLSAAGVESLSLPSFPLGVSARSDFPTRSWELSAGDRIVFLTDGLVETTNAQGEPFGFERLEALLHAEAASDAERIEEAILDAVARHGAGVPLEDDRTLVVLTLL